MIPAPHCIFLPLPLLSLGSSLRKIKSALLDCTFCRKFSIERKIEVGTVSERAILHTVKANLVISFTTLCIQVQSSTLMVKASNVFGNFHFSLSVCGLNLISRRV